MTKRATVKQATIARALRAVQQVGGGQIIKIEADGSITVLPPAPVINGDKPQKPVQEKIIRL